MKADTHQETILVIEDDRALGVGLDLNLSAEGFRVLLVADGEQGLAAALEEEPDLVILDLMLPGMDGFTILSDLRSYRREMPVIILSARGEEYDKVRGFDVGADDYVTKPFSLAELVARINAALRRPRMVRQENRCCRFGGVVVDCLARTVTRNGKEVAFTARELDLLIHLATHPGRAYRRDELLRIVWGYNYDGTARTVDNFLRSLRAKLETNPAAPRHFVTVHGVGYRFEP